MCLFGSKQKGVCCFPCLAGGLSTYMFIKSSDKGLRLKAIGLDGMRTLICIDSMEIELEDMKDNSCSLHAGEEDFEEKLLNFEIHLWEGLVCKYYKQGSFLDTYMSVSFYFVN